MNTQETFGAAAVHVALGHVATAEAVRSIVRLPGWNNATYRVTLADGDVIVRLPGTSGLVDRVVEAHNLRLAASSGVGPEVLAADPETGVLVYRAVAGTPWNPAAAGGIVRVAACLRRLHGSGAAFAGRLDAVATVARYVATLARRTTRVAREAMAAAGPALTLAQDLAIVPGDLAPCHNDLVPGNIIDDGRDVTFVDWEFSGRNDPLWDVAYVAVEGDLGAGDRRRLFEAYGVAPDQMDRLGASMRLCLAINGLWAAAESSGRADLEAYAADRLRRFANPEKDNLS